MKGFTTSEILLVIGVIIVSALIMTPIYFRVNGDIAVCKEFYPNMNKLECYFSSKTVRVPK